MSDSEISSGGKMFMLSALRRIKSIDKVVTNIGLYDVLDKVAKFGIVFAALGYILEADDRELIKKSQLWSLIYASPISAPNGARVSAIEAAARDGLSLHSLHLPCAWLAKANFNNNSKFNALAAFLVDGHGASPDLITLTDVSKADFSGADLWNADFSATDLYETEFRSAYLAGAVFHRAYLKDAKFTSAYLGGADFSQAYGLSPSQLKEACVTDDTRLPPNFTKQDVDLLPRCANDRKPQFVCKQ